MTKNEMKTIRKWHKVGCYEVYTEDGTEDGTVIHGVDRSKGVTVYPYRHNKKYDSWINEKSITLSALRSGLNRGTIILL